MSALSYWLVLAALLFCIGAFGVLVRRNVIHVVMSIEVILNAVNLALVAAANFRGGGEGTGAIFALFVIVLAAAEVAIGLAIIIANYRNKRTVDADRFDELKG